jgi:small subunit ribosomal protein S13
VLNAKWSSAEGIFILFVKTSRGINKSKVSFKFIICNYIMRISGITLPNKRIEYALTAVYGIGIPLAKKIVEEAGIKLGKKPDELSTDDENSIRRVVEKFKIEGDLKREVSANIKRLKDIGSYRGSRHAKGLPSRGQRTKTNSRTRRGNTRKTMGSGRKKVEKK